MCNLEGHFKGPFKGPFKGHALRGTPVQDELLAAERYYDKLVPQCVDPGHHPATQRVALSASFKGPNMYISNI